MNDNCGYKKLVVWNNAYKLRRLIYETTKRFSKSELRRISQMRDAARSIKQNIQEGYGKSLGEYIHSLETSKGSLRELSGDIEDCFDDGLITKEEFDKLHELCAKTDYLFMRLIQSLRRKQNLNRP
jgi:four helix bundle protein